MPEVYRNPEQYGEGTDWFDKITRNALMQNYGVTIRSGNDKLQSTIVASYSNQEGMLINTGYERFNFRVNTLYTPTERIWLGVNLAPSSRKHENQDTAADGRRLPVRFMLLLLFLFIMPTAPCPKCCLPWAR